MTSHSAVVDAVHRYATQNPAQIALVGDAEVFTYLELHDAVMAIAAELRDRRPHIIGLLADNSPAWVIVELAAIIAGIPIVPIPAFFTAAQIGHLIQNAGIDVVVSIQAFPGLRNDRITIAGTALNWVETGAPSVKLPPGTAKITYTSGTTGTPKGICLSQSHLETVAKSIVDALSAEYAARHVAVMPLAILLENVAGLYPTLIVGGTYIVHGLRRLGYSQGLVPDRSMLVSALEEAKATSCILVPELLRAIIEAQQDQRRDLSAMKFVAVGGARVAPDLIRLAHDTGLPVYEGYGLSECGSVVALNTPKAIRSGSVGRPLAHVRLSLAADGEIIIDEPGLLGVLGDHQWQPSKLATGDIGSVDADGYVRVIGRKKNVIVTSLGRNIAPEWVESELTASNRLQTAIAFGDEDHQLTALVVPREMNLPDATIQNIIDAANAKLPDYARVGSWQRIAPLSTTDGTLTANGRPRREQILAKFFAHHRPTFFDRLSAAVGREQAELFNVPHIVDGLAGQISRETYIAYLAQAYHHVKHTVPLLRETRRLLPESMAWLRTVLDSYIDEETGHEAWILDDITNAGGDAVAVETNDPHPATQAMVDYAYDYIRNKNPVGFFGMVFVLEGTSIALASRGAGALMRALKLPANCFSYLMSHGSLDVEHMAFFRDIVNRIETPQDQSAIIEMARAMYGLFADVFRSIPHKQGLAYAAQ